MHKKIEVNLQTVSLFAICVSIVPIACIRYVFWEYVTAVVLFLIIMLVMLWGGEKTGIVKIKDTGFLSEAVYIIVIIAGFVSFYYTDVYDGTGIVRGSYFISDIANRKSIIWALAFCIMACIVSKFHIKIINLAVVFCGLGFIMYVASIFYTENIAAYDLHYDAYFYPVCRMMDGENSYIDFHNIYGGMVFFWHHFYMAVVKILFETFRE